MLNDGIRFAPLYEPVMNSDHLPMTLCALRGLGGNDDFLLSYKSEYEARLQTIEPEPALADWRQGLGQRARYPGLLAYFLDTEITPALISDVLQICLPGVALDAFHPIIRLGYALDFEADKEKAAALAYLVSVHSDMPHSANRVSLEEQLQHQAAMGPVELKSARFGPSMQELAGDGRYPVGRADDLEALANAALAIYQSTRNFFALHLVTATQALRCSLTEDNMELGVSSMTGAMMASHLVVGSPAIGDPVDVPTVLDPEHAYKYAWVCASEYQAYGNDAYLEEISKFKQAGLLPEWVAVPKPG